jgi:tetratricopeptide (TPR) repeat protein
MKSLLVLLLLLPLVARSQDDALSRGLAFFNQQNYSAALEAFQEAKRARPPNAQLENIIGITESRLGQIDAANHSYETALRLDPKLADAHKNLGYNLIGEKKYELAEKELKAALALNPSEPFTHYYMVILYVTTSRDKEAVAHIRAAEPALVDDANTTLLAIKAALNAGNPEDALELTQQLQAKARLTGNQIAQLLAGVAAAYESMGAPEKALDAYQKAIAADPANPDSYLDATRLLIDRDRYQEATALVEQGIPLVPDAYPLIIRQGAIAGMQGDRASARAAYRKAIALHPTVALGYVALAQSYNKEGNDQQALSVLDDARKVIPSDFALEYVYGLILLETGQHQAALEPLQTAARLNPAIPEPHFQLGVLYMKTQRWKDAEAEFEQVLKLDPRNAATYSQLSRTYQRLGETAKAQEASKQASALAQSERDPSKNQALQFGVPH